jgi:hypothetical protein
VGIQAGGLAVDITSKQNSHEHNIIRCLTITEHQGGTDGCIRDSKYPAEAVDFPIDIKARSGVGVYADFGISVGKTGYQRQDMIYVSFLLERSGQIPFVLVY